MSTNPYANYVAGEDLLRSLERTPRRIEHVASAWPPEAFERSHAPGKWTARQVLTHLAQAEIVFGNRLRFGLAEDGYVVQPFDQDAWMRVEPRLDGHAALAAYLGLRQMNLALCRIADGGAACPDVHASGARPGDGRVGDDLLRGARAASFAAAGIDRVAHVGLRAQASGLRAVPGFREQRLRPETALSPGP